MAVRHAALLLLCLIGATYAMPIRADFAALASRLGPLQAAFEANDVTKANAAGNAYEARTKRGDDQPQRPIPQVSGVSPIPFWDTSFLYLGGQSRFVQNRGVANVTDPGSPSVALPFLPVVGATRPATKQFILKDPVAGQYTGPVRLSTNQTVDRYYIWFPKEPLQVDPATGSIAFQCYQELTGWNYEAAQHRLSYYQNVTVTIGVDVPIGRSGRFRTEQMPAYFYNGFTKETGGTPSWLSYSGFFDVYTLRAFQLNFSQGQGGPRIPGQVCTSRPAIVSGEYNWNIPGVRVLPGSAITDDVWIMDRSCYVGGNAANGVDPNLPIFSQVVDFS